MYPLAPYSCVVFSHSLTLSLSLLARLRPGLDCCFPTRRMQQQRTSTEPRRRRRRKRAFSLKSWATILTLFCIGIDILLRATSYIIHFKMFCTNSWRKKVYTPLHSQSIKLYFVLKSICGMQLADASMYCAVCGGGSTLKNAIRLLYLSKIPIW